MKVHNHILCMIVSTYKTNLVYKCYYSCGLSTVSVLSFMGILHNLYNTQYILLLY